MDAFITRKKRKISESSEPSSYEASAFASLEEDSTELKLAILASLHPNVETGKLLEILTSVDGSVETAIEVLVPRKGSETSPRKRQSPADIQSSLRFGTGSASVTPGPAAKPLTRKGKTLHLYSSEDIDAHTPCSIIHNFLPAELANALLSELLTEAPTFGRASFKLFDNVVQSPHSASFYVSSLKEVHTQKTEYLYNGSYLSDVRQISPLMKEVSELVKDAVNAEIQKRIKDHYPKGEKLRFQSPKQWQPNAAFVNCYAGPKESVGYHSDQLTYLGPRATIGSISLGVARAFRIRKIEAKDDANISADASGQISIHLPHNSLLVMHAEMQEEWKHSIAPAQNITPHPISGINRLNITYRWYKESLHPKYTPKCRCGVACVLKCVQTRKETRGRYMWMCHAGNAAQAEKGKDGCTFFQWAEFDDDGEPVWGKGSRAADITSPKGNNRDLVHVG